MENYLRLKRNEIHPEKLATLELPRKTISILTDKWRDKSLSDYNNNNVNIANVESNDINYNSTIFTIQSSITTQIRTKEKADSNNKNHWLYIVIFLLTCLSLTALVTIIIMSQDKQETCVTQSCLQAASMVLKYMNATVNPCNNFYDFACGNYVNDPNIQDDSIFYTLRADVNSQVKALFEKSRAEDKSKHYNLLKRLYQVCMNANDKPATDTIKEILRSLGDWPLLHEKNWIEKNFDWSQLVYKMRQIGLNHNYFIIVNTQLAFKKDDRHVALLNSMTMTSLNSSKLSEIADELGLNKMSTEQDIKDVLNFTKNISALLCRRSLTNFTGQTISKLHTMWPDFNWISFISNVINIPELNITEEYIIFIPSSSCLNDTLKLLQRTPKRIQANFMFFHSVIWMHEIFTDSKNILQFMTSTNSTASSKLRSGKCIDDLSRSLRLPLHLLYVKKYFNKNKKLQVENLVEAIRGELYEIIKAAEWLDESTKAHALDKLVLMKKYIGYPDDLINEKYIEDYYDKMEINFANYLTALMSVHAFNQHRKYSQLLRLESNWVKHSNVITVNAFYYPGENCIEVPAAILQNTVFDENRPNYLNYGMVGAIIGHEITHGFDSRGRNFDKNGNLHDWWSANTSTTFQEKVQCIIDQYQNYEYPGLGLKVNGKLTQGENIADNGGIKQAYLAYQNLVMRNGAEKILPGLKYSQNQMFWISTAQFWCAKSNLERIKHQLISDPHSPNRFRVIGALSNFNEFSEDFNCPIDAPMNPKKKCKVW